MPSKSASEYMIKDVVKVVNMKILGKEKHPANWHIMTAKDLENKTVLGQIGMFEIS
jgi:hypothetical protein